MQKISWMMLAFVFFNSSLYAQDIVDLGAGLDSGSIRIVQLHGNGSSSGTSLEGQIENLTQNELRIAVNLRRPLYFGNRGGSGQNMIAVSIFEDGGRYYSDGESSFISLMPGRALSVQLTAYCADFDKENPSVSDSFAIADTPEEISEIALKISRYEAANAEFDLTVPSQLALWLSQGNSASEIQEKFAFSASDERVAREILAQPTGRFRLIER